MEQKIAPMYLVWNPAPPSNPKACNENTGTTKKTETMKPIK